MDEECTSINSCVIFISLGFTHVAACRLINTSLIPMTFYLRVPSDGTGHLASSIAGSFLSDAYIDESQLHQPPKEFEIYPNTGTLAPQTEVEIQVKYDTRSMIRISMHKYNFFKNAGNHNI